MEKETKSCAAGCVAYSGGELKHHKDCVFYPNSLSQKYDNSQSQLKEAVNFLYVDDNECRYDHNGWCQTHNMEQPEKHKCPMIRIRELILKHY